MNSINQTSSTHVPDSDTKERIKNLAQVGIALMQVANENTHQTNFYYAEEALNRFEAGLNKLELDEESRQGMKDLIEYLRVKIARRLHNNLVANSQY